MSQKTRAEGSARERLQAQRDKEKARARRGRQAKVAAVVVAVLAVAAGIAIWATSTGGDKSTPIAAPKGATGGDKPMVTVGRKSAPSTLQVWEDFRCPACKQFETGFRSTLHELQDNGQLRTDYHLALLIDGNMGGKGSLNAGNAALCAQDAGKFRDYHDVLFTNQPGEQQDRYKDKNYLIELAGKVPGLVTEDFRSCVHDGKYNGFVQKSHEAFQSGGFQGTPTVKLNGKDLLGDQGAHMTPQKLKQMVLDANKKK
ncbi:DsbA family protein [Streptomyces olivaceiscleroticus]|uniref:Thioredoxin domain-containing protein n=1 Tax=Streptomyces olivaceiscleroticus TaxID=68245 RepID=A0ABP3KRC5_9ACTN